MLKTVTNIVNASQIIGVLPVVNGGTGVTTSTGTGSVVLSAAPTLSGNVGLSTGNIVPATAAKGINFTANTPAAGMTSQLLNWYEEGTFTAAYRSNSATIVMTAGNTGRYTRIGRVVTIQATITTDSFSGGTIGNFLYFTGLPFTAGYGAVGLIGSAYSWGVNSPSSAEVNNGSNEALMYTRLTANAGVTPMTYGDLAAGAAQNGINIVMTYTV